MALGSMTTAVVAALFLVTATLAIQTAAMRPAVATTSPAGDGYAAATTTDKSIEKTGGEATTAAPAKTAEDFYAKAIEFTKTADKYMKEDATATSPKNAAIAKKAADLYSAMAQTQIALGDKSVKETGEHFVTQKELESLSAELKKTSQAIIATGDKKSPAIDTLWNAAALTLEAQKYLQEAAIATSPEKAAAAKKVANEKFTAALMYVAFARLEAKAPPAAAGGVVDNKPAQQATKAAAPKEAYSAGTV